MKRADAVAILVVGVVLVAEVSILRALSITYDEVVHIGAGLSHLERREIVLNAEHPPLMKLAGGALPFALGAREGPLGARLYPAPGADIEAVKRVQYRYGEAVIARDNERFRLPGALDGADALTEAARVPFLLAPLCVLGVGWLWARARFGPRGALVTLLLLATYPDLLGHGALVKNDVPLAALALAGGFLCDRLAREGGWWRVAALGVVCGLALATKYTAVVIVAGLAVSMLVALRTSPLGPPPLRGGGIVLAAFLVICISILILSLAYLGHSPFASYVSGATHAYSEKGEGFKALLLDRYKPRFYTYFLVALALKLPLGTIALLGLTASVLARKRGAVGEETILHATPLLYFVFLSAIALDIGTRYVIPCLPFFCVSAGRLAEWARGSRARWLGLGAALALNAGAVALQHPFEGSYGNALAGSPRTFYKLLDDSNQDWGGGFKALAAWQQDHPEPLTVVVHATAFAARNLGAYGVKANVRLGDVLFAPEKGRVYAVSADVVSRMRLLARERGVKLPLGDELEPAEVVGGGILIFRP